MPALDPRLHDFSAIPVVDVAPLLSGDADGLRDVATALGRAARDVGFLYVTGHGIPQAVFDDLLAVTERFFALPREESCASTSRTRATTAATSPRARRSSARGPAT